MGLFKIEVKLNQYSEIVSPFYESNCNRKMYRSFVRGCHWYENYIIMVINIVCIKLQKMFGGMSRNDTDTLPRKRGAVVISEGTIGRHAGHGLETAA